MKYNPEELIGMANTALAAREQGDMRWLMLAGVICGMFNITERELVSRLEEYANGRI